MKNFTNNLKQFTSRLSARWLIMALMLLVGTSSAWGAKLYFDLNGHNGLLDAGAVFRAYFYGGSGDQWANFTQIANDDVYECAIPGTGYKNVIILRAAPGSTGWNNEWGRVSINNNTDLTLPTDGKNLCKVNGDYKDNKIPSIWSTYTPPCTTVTITWNDFTDNMCVGSGQELTATASHGTVSYSSDNSNATISGIQLTASKAGSATITASVAASGNYCSATANKTVTISNCIPEGTVLYLKPGTNWKSDNARFALHIFKDGGQATWVKAIPVCNNEGYYEATVPEGVWEELIWCRMNPSTTEDTWNNRWNQTADLTYDGTKNLFTVADGAWDGSTTTWSAWTPKPCCTTVNAPNVTADAICAGSTATLTLSERQEGVTYRLNNSKTGDIIFSSENTYTTPTTLNANTTYKIYASHTNACTNDVEGEVIVTVASAPTTPTLNTTDEFLSIGESATLTIGNKESDVTYTLYKDGVSTSKVPNGNQFTNIKEPGTYKVKGKKSANPSGCQETGFSNDVTIRTCTSATYSIAFTNDVTSINTDATILASVTPSGTGYGTVTWESETTSVATIDASGVITGVKFGTSKITATVADGDTYCGGTATETITVKETPTITIGGETEFCGESTTLTATIGNITGGNSYNIKWYEDGNNTEKVTGSAFSPTKSGTYIVKVTGKFVNETSKTVVVTKKAYPTAANFTVTNNNYTYDGAAKAATVKWTDNQSAEGITVTYNPATPKDADIYDIQVTTTAHGDLCASNGAITLGDKLTINKADQTTALTITASTNICGKEATFSVTGGDGTGDYSYSLDKNDAGVSLNGTTLTATQNGSVTLKVKKLGDTNYNDSEEAVKMFNFTMPIENVTLSKVEDDKTTYCVGDRVEFKLNYNGPYPANYAWSGSAMGSLEATGKTANELDNGASWYINFTEAKTYTIALSLTGCNTQSSNELSFTVNALPGKPTFDAIPAQCGSYTLPAEDKNQVNVIWYTAATGGDKIITPVTQSGTYYAEAVSENNCTSTQRTAVEIIIDKAPTISGETFTQPGKTNAIELTVPDGITAQWSVEPEADLSVTEGNSTMFSAEKNGRYTITATNGTCSDTHVVTVADAFYIYFRNAKKGETAYANFYDPNQNTEEVQGGEMFYAECDALPTNGNNSLPTHFVNYNKGGRKADIITTDCDGYTWYGFKASAEVVAGTKYFYVHATNNKNYNGHYTHTVPTKKALTSDVYYTLGTTNHTTTHYGWNITLASAPYSGPVVHALGSTTLGTDEFAALYVTDCSGKEIDAYQWEYCRTEDGTYQPYSSVCSYTFEKKDVVKTENSDAGETNNIRPSELGYYRCKVTYEDGTTATSAAVEISGSYNRSFTSTIPVLVVNTGNKDFPGCQATGTDNYPSKYADDLKAKRSVDVKIYDEKGALVYDRKARMAYRGSSSLNFTKKSYAFCPGDANCGDKDKGEDYVKTAKLNMLGVGTACDKDWVLYAAAADPSLMRNRMVFDTYQAMTGTWGVNSRYVELIVDGDYKGVYVFMDKITMNKERVKVDEDKGFIVKFDKTDCADRVEGYNGIFGDQKTFSTKRTGRTDISTYHTTVDQLFEIEYPEKDDYPTGWANKVASIKEMFQAFEDALEEGDYATVQKYIDYDSWADWFIINEFTKNLDAYRASCIFVYTGEAGAKIEARPLWDQELSFNNAAANISGKGANSTSGLLIQNDGVYTDCFPAPFWFTGQLATFETCGGNNGSGAKGDKLANCLLNDPCFVQVVKEKWNQHQLGALSAEELGKLITKYDNELGYIENSGSEILKRESTKWPDGFRTSADCSAGDTGYNSVSYSNSKTAITSWIADGAGGRREGLTTAINGLTGASFSIQIIPSEAKTTPWEPVEITVSVTPAGYDYKLEYTGDNNLGGVANTIIKEEGDKITYRIPRPSDWGAGDAEEGKRTDIEYGIKATLSVQEGTTVCGSQAAPSSTGKIILQDEDNDNCK